MCAGANTGLAHLCEEPVQLHAFGGGVAALDETRATVDVHQALVVIVIYGGTEEPDVEQLGTGVVHILKQTMKLDHSWS